MNPIKVEESDTDNNPLFLKLRKLISLVVKNKYIN